MFISQIIKLKFSASPSITVRASISCTARLLPLPPAYSESPLKQAWKSVNCYSLMVSTLLFTNHVMPSVQGGVVKDPGYVYQPKSVAPNSLRKVWRLTSVRSVPSSEALAKSSEVSKSFSVIPPPAT